MKGVVIRSKRFKMSNTGVKRNFGGCDDMGAQVRIAGVMIRINDGAILFIRVLVRPHGA